MESYPDDRRVARPDSWKTKEMPVAVTVLSLEKTYSPEEFDVLSCGFVPKVMEQKWFIYMKDSVLFFHRSWTGLCIYKIVFEQNGAGYVVKEAFVNRDIEQHPITDINYDCALVSWLMDGFLLENPVPFPSLRPKL